MIERTVTLRRWDETLVTLGVRAGHYVDPNEVDGPHLDLRHLWALPGLADCHAHLSADSLEGREQPGEIAGIRRRAFAQLGAGVFLLIDKGWRDGTVLQLLSEPPADRPALQAAGRIITGTNGYFPGFAVETDEAGLVDEVRAADKRGGWVKLIGDWPQKGRGPVISFGEETLAAAVAVAHQGGARVAIHTMAEGTPGIAVRAGVDSIEHGLYLTPPDLELLTRRQGAWVPTLVNTESVVRSMGTGSTGARILGEGLDNVRRLLPLAEGWGTNILCGTDLGLPHGAVAREAMRLHQYGLPATSALRAVGPAAYEYVGRGFLSAGVEADLILLDQDPTRALDVLAHPVAGLRGGRVVFDRAGVLAP